MRLDVVRVLRAHVVEGLDLERSGEALGPERLPKHGHPAVTRGQFVPGVSGDPHGPFEVVLSDGEGRGGQHGVREGQRAHVEGDQVEQLHGSGVGQARILGQDEGLVFGRLIAVDGLHEDLHPAVGGHWGEAPFEGLDYDQLHVEDFILGAGAVGHISEFLQLGRVNLLDFGPDK